MEATTKNLPQIFEADDSLSHHTLMTKIDYHEAEFRRQVLAALNSARKVLDAERKPSFLDDASPHEYADKFAVAELMANTAVAAGTNVWNVLGLGPDHQQTVLDWVHRKKLPVTLRFVAHDTCTFLKEVDVDVRSPHGDYTVATKTEKSGLLGFNSSSTKTESVSITRKIKEFHWKVGIEHQLIVFPGNSSKDGIILQSRKTETVLITQQHGTPPLPESTVHGAVDVSLTWFFQQIDPNEQSCKFAIKRDSEKTKTPRRNEQVEEAIEAHKELLDWSRITQGFFFQRVEREIMGKDNPAVPRTNKRDGFIEPGGTGIIQGLSREPTFNGQRVRIISYENGRYKAEPTDDDANLPPTLSIKPSNIKPDESPSNGPPLSTITDDTVLIPVLPLMEGGAVMTDVGEFLQEQARSLDEAIDGLARMYPSRNLVKLVSIAEASLILICKHLERLCRMFSNGMDHVENMLLKQLVSAVGKSVNADDFNKFMKYHYPRLLGSQFAPVPFCRAIRQQGHFPDGLIAIEQDGEPISTWSRKVSGSNAAPIKIPIHAAASVEITGDRFLHGWMMHNFASSAPPKPQLACRARQFSSFLVILGTVAGPDSFDPKEAIILQNKDEVLIPLMLTPLPSAKEFRDAIQSLSPEQQEFAKAFRGMQLSSSVFGVCVVQLKPQLEKLLELPKGSLTKEIQLTQDLMSLFIDYQIPSDMLTYDGPSDSTIVDKVAAVKGYVKSVMDVIDDNKKKQLKEEEMKADMRGELQYKQFVDADVLEQGLVLECRDVQAKYMDVSPAFKNQAAAYGEKVSTRRATRGMHLNAGQSVALSAPAPSAFGAAPTHKSSAPPPTSNARGRSLASSVPERKRQAASHDGFASASSFEPKNQDAVKNSAIFDDGNDETNPLNNDGSLPAKGSEDFTLIPKLLDSKLEELDDDGALRSTTIKASDRWTRSRQENFLVGPKTSPLTAGDITLEKKRAFDLLDCITRSGTLPIDCSELHVFIAVSHFFEKDCVQTIVQDNVNPIAKVERSALILASVAFGESPQKLLRNEQDTNRLREVFPKLFAIENSE